MDMELESINNDEKHGAALIEIERLWNSEEGAPEGDRLNVLSALVEAYEETNFSMDPPRPTDAIKFRRQQQSQGDRP
jgi:HTH-type transcriptional regulator / antitoxin HigA